MSWPEYYKKFEGKSPRPLLLEVLKMFNFTPGLRAIDLGCGAGVETLHLLQCQWDVVAVEKEIAGIETLQEGLSDSLRSKVSIIHSSFENLRELPQAHLVFAGLSIPFCRPESLKPFWQVVEKSILPQGYFAGNFFGPDDDWVREKGLSGLSAEELREFFKDFEIIKWDEKNEMGPTALGPNKNWHVFTVVARKRLSS
ncbi:MAG: hypothetical protein KF865_08605 [Bdellovibrionaceae bacterium]|nr:hypothetical protein [Pseudobdellovibrionaceae bacterium]